MVWVLLLTIEPTYYSFHYPLFRWLALWRSLPRQAVSCGDAVVGIRLAPVMAPCSYILEAIRLRRAGLCILRAGVDGILSINFQLPKNLTMCGRRKIRYRCEHEEYFGGIHYCARSRKSPSGRKIMCGYTRTTSMFASENVCGKSDCLLSRYNGRWNCCTCDETGNRYRLCDNGSCNHHICRHCRPCTSNLFSFDTRQLRSFEAEINRDYRPRSIIPLDQSRRSHLSSQFDPAALQVIFRFAFFAPPLRP